MGHNHMLHCLAKQFRKLKPPPERWPGLERVTNSFQVSVSRSIRSLRAKGLVNLRIWNVKTMEVGLTEQGRELAEQLMLRCGHRRPRLSSR